MDEPQRPESLKSRAIAGGKWTAGSAILGVTIQMLQLAALGRLLGPSEFGMMAIMMVVIGLANSIADFGLANYLVQAESINRGLLDKLISMGLSLSLVLWGVVALIADTVAAYYEMAPVSYTLPWFGLVTVLNTITQLYTAVLQRRFKFQQIAIIDVMSATAGLVISVWMADTGFGLWALVIGQLGMALLKAVLSWLVALPLINQIQADTQHETSNAVRFGAYQVGERVLNFASANFDKLIIGKLLGDQALGIYSVAFQLILRPILVINPIFNRVAMPMFSKVKNDNARLIRGYIEMLRTICFVTFPIYLLLCVSAPIIIGLLMGAKWQNAAALTSILSLLGFLYAAGNPIGVLVVAKGRVDFALYFNAVVVIINLIACYCGSLLGINWVALLLVLASWLILFPLEFYLRHKLIGMRISEYIVALKPHFIATGIPLVVFVIIHQFGILPINEWTSATAGLISIISYFGYFYIIDREIIYNTLELIFPKRLIA